MEKRLARPRAPVPFDRGPATRRNLPVGFEATEVVQTDDIHQLQHLPHPLDPPRVARRRQYIPTIDGVAPALAGRAEIVRRNAGDHRRLAVRVELEEVAVYPDVGAVVRHEDREVA